MRIDRHDFQIMYYFKNSYKLRVVTYAVTVTTHCLIESQDFQFTSETCGRYIYKIMLLKYDVFLNSNPTYDVFRSAYLI
jgi:hypothetical protein